ncbi:hypothetical protein AC1031_006557 [Aphanomyces cochlioides]|nr:hypothetical protein AC1031_006557 [Aphanomyces cochlioides]
MQKVSVLEQQYRSARDWLNNTGQGIEDEASIEAEVRKICPYYYDLDGVMHDRASSEALATSDNLNDSDNEKITEDLPVVSRKNIKKRTTAETKLDEWTDMNNKSVALKEKEIEQRERELSAKTNIDNKRLQIEEQREARLSREGVRLLQIQHEQALFQVAMQR